MRPCRWLKNSVTDLQLSQTVCCNYSRAFRKYWGVGDRPLSHPYDPPPCPTLLPHLLAPPTCPTPLPWPALSHSLIPPSCLTPCPTPSVHHCFLTGSVFTLGLFGCCCPCCFMISLSQRMGEGCCFPICCPGALLAMRVKLRSENGIQVRYSTTSIPILFINEPDVFLTH